MAVRHDQVLTDHEAGAAVGIVGVARQLDAPDGGDGLEQYPSFFRLVVVEREPKGMVGAELLVNDVENRANVGQDNRFKTGCLLGRGALPRAICSMPLWALLRLSVCSGASMASKLP